MPTLAVYPFWVLPVDGTPDEMRSLVRDFAAEPQDLDFAIRDGEYRATEFAWNGRRGALTASVFKVRASDLPSALDEDGSVRPLPLDEATDLGEPLVFAYYPAHEVAVVPYTHNGPHHPVVASVLTGMGHPTAIRVSPVIRRDVLRRLRSARMIRSMEFSLHSPEAARELRAAGQPVGRALQMLGDTGGANISIKVTMGHQQGSLVDGVKDTIGRLAELGDTSLSKLKVHAAQRANQDVESLDLLNARVTTELDVVMRGREIDRDDCRRKLTGVFRHLQPEIDAQRRARRHR